MNQIENQDNFINDAINQAIEITLKEYENLKDEISQRSQNLTQVVFLGLAAIATIISFTLPQFVNFLTSEDITIQQIDSFDFQSSCPYIEETQQSVLSYDQTRKSLELCIEIPDKEVTLNIISNEEEKVNKTEVKIPNDIRIDLSNLLGFKVNRTIETDGIARTIGLFIFIFAIVIPIICFYLIQFVIQTIRRITIIENYLAYDIQNKLNDCFLKK